MKFSSLAISCMLLTVACSKVKDLDKRTESMEKSTEKVSKTTDEMKDTTTIMYQQIRAKEAEDTREQKFQILMDDKANMGERLLAAGVYFKSMEHQLWNNNTSFDDKNNRDVLLLDASDEFTRRMMDLYGPIFLKVGEHMNPLQMTKMEMSFYALAATMHRNNHFQDLVTGGKDAPKLSFYDIVKNALMKDTKGEELLKYEEVLVQGNNRLVMIDLIRARVNIFAKMAYGTLSDKKLLTVESKEEGNGPHANRATLLAIDTYLGAALSAKKFLIEIKQPVEVHPTLKKLLSDISEEPSKDKKSDPATDARKEMIKALIK